MKESKSLIDILTIIKRNYKLIATFGIISILISGFVSFLLITPIYQASTQLLVTQSGREDGQFNLQDIQADLQLINTYSIIIKSPTILNQVKENTGIDYSLPYLLENITVDNAENSQVVDIVVRDQSHERAVLLANEIANVFNEEIRVLMQVDNVSILTPAVLENNPTPVDPNPLLNMAIAFVVGSALGVAIAFLISSQQPVISKEENVEGSIEDIPLWGFVRTNSEKNDGRKSKMVNEAENIKPTESV